MALQGVQKWRKEDLISFPKWRAALARVTSGVERIAHEKAIFGFLRFRKVSGSPTSIGVAKLYIEQVEEQVQKRDKEGTLRRDR